MTSNTQALMDEGRPTLDDLVLAALEKAKALRSHLALEAEAIAAHEASDLPVVFETKATLASALEQLEQSRRAVCQARFGTSHPDSTVLNDALSPAALQAWRDYGDELSACQEANAVNGKLVHARQRHVRRALDILRGQPANDPGLYNARGATDTKDHRQALGRA